MHSSTLRGVFPEPKPTYRRNFIKENVKSIKHMQGLLQDAGIIQQRHKEDKFRNTPLLKSRDSTPHKFLTENKVKTNKPIKKATAVGFSGGKLKLDRKKDKTENIEYDEKFTHRSMQTERTDDLTKLYQTGVIKYPSQGVSKIKTSEVTPQKTKGEMKAQGDCKEDGVLEDEMQNLEIEEKDYIKENMSNLKPKVVKQAAPKVPAQPPPNYQRGVVPKYLRDRKEEDLREDHEEPCPDGHVLLPEEERKETLRVLRQSYADRIQELNSLPVRSDTLRVKKRKMEIEEELKRIDGGIKVFQRPKVYVKINA